MCLKNKNQILNVHLKSSEQAQLIVSKWIVSEYLFRLVHQVADSSPLDFRSINMN